MRIILLVAAVVVVVGLVYLLRKASRPSSREKLDDRDDRTDE